MVPTISILVALVLGNDTAYTLLLFSIPCLTILLISPSQPSISHLSPSLLRTSSRLFERLRNLYRDWGLLWPLILLVFVVFSISMDGDIYRGFFFHPTSLFGFISSPFLISSSSRSDISNLDERDERDELDRTTPTEDGVAPFEARLVIFSTLIVLIVLAIMVSFQPSSDPKMGEHETVNNTAADRIRKKSLQYRIIAIRQLIGDLRTPQPRRDVENVTSNNISLTTRRLAPSVPTPFNLLLVPLDVACGFSQLINRVFSSQLERNQDGLGDLLYRIRFALAVFLVGPLCLPLFALDQTITILTRQ